MPASRRILAVRLGAMGDILFTLPAVATLKHSFPGFHVTWAVEPQWAPLLEENPFVDRVLPVRRDSLRSLGATWRELRAVEYDFAVDFQGLIKSALVAATARARRIYGLDRTQAREAIAAAFYSDTITSRAVHMVDKHLDLARGAGAANVLRIFPLPQGAQESDLPAGDFVLASPLAGWRGKQWPLENYRELAIRLRRETGIPLVLDGPASALPLFAQVREALPHASGIPGLIFATRCAAAVVGVDSGPLHIAAALNKPGVALYGPTNPARNGPYGSSFEVLRAPEAETTYQRESTIAESMRRLSPDLVFETLRGVLHARRPSVSSVS